MEMEWFQVYSIMIHDFQALGSLKFEPKMTTSTRHKAYTERIRPGHQVKCTQVFTKKYLLNA